MIFSFGWKIVGWVFVDVGIMVIIFYGIELGLMIMV